MVNMDSLLGFMFTNPRDEKGVSYNSYVISIIIQSTILTVFTMSSFRCRGQSFAPTNSYISPTVVRDRAASRSTFCGGGSTAPRASASLSKATATSNSTISRLDRANALNLTTVGSALTFPRVFNFTRVFKYSKSSFDVIFLVQVLRKWTVMATSTDRKI